MAKSLKLLNRRTVADDNGSAADNTEHSCYEIQIIGGAVIKKPLKKKNKRRGNSDGTFSNRRYFSCASQAAVSVSLDRLTPLSQYLKEEEPEFTDSARKLLVYERNTQSGSIKKNLLPQLSHGRTDHGLKICQRDEALIGDYPARGTVRYIGEEKDSSGNVQTSKGLQLDEKIGTAGTGRRNERQLFRSENGFAEFVESQSDDGSLEQGAGLPQQTLETGQTVKQIHVHRQLELKGKPDPISNTKVRENEERNLQQELSHCRVQLSNIQQQLTSLKTELKEKTDETTMCQRIKNLERQLLVKEEQETTVNSALQEMEKQKGAVEIQLRRAEEELRNCQAELFTTSSRQHEQLREKEQQEETVRTQFVEIERLRGQLVEKETRETRLREQLRETRQQSKSVQRQLMEMERQFTEKEKREDNLRTQLREMEQQLREKMTEKENRETEFREQLRERDQREANIQRQLRLMEQQLTAKEEREENLRRQLREMEQQWTNFQHQYREREVENIDLRRQVTSLDGQIRSLPHDWIIPRNEIQMTDKCLGSGAYARVLEGRYCGCAVAVKQMHLLIDSPHYQRLFVREIDIASRCRHPCLLQFIGATNDEETPLLVTELMEISLRHLLGQRRLSPTEISVISLDVARALNYLHQKRPVPIIHRDISSANVLLWQQAGRQDGNQEGQWRGKVSDYGTAKFREQVMTIGPGCPVYSAPEASTTNQTVKIDIYSFGVLLCEMCIGDPPERERRDEQVAMMTDHVLQVLVRRCLQLDPRDRPDMVEIINELEQFYERL